MHQLIKVLPKFIREKIHNEEHLLHSSPDDIQKWLGYLEFSKDHLLDEIHQDILLYQNLDQSKLYIKTIYHSIYHLRIELLEKINAIPANAPDTSRPIKFLEECNHILNYILSNITEYYNPLIDTSPVIPIRSNKALKWKGPKVGLIELARACKEAGALDETLQEIYTCFEEFFSIRLDNPSRTFQEILSRKKDESSYLQKLATKLKEQKERMIENYTPRK